MKNKKLWTMILSLIVMLCVLFSFTACGETHEHTFGDWQKDENEHWKICTDPKCDKPNEKFEKSSHTGNPCTVCGTAIVETHEHTLGDWQKDERGHWKICTDPECDKPNEKFEESTHTYGEWIVKDEPTCTIAGLKECECECGYKGTESISELGHDIVNGKCSRCEYVERQESEGLVFELNEDGQSYYVAGIGTCEDTDVIIPSVYESKPVTEIGLGAFGGCMELTSIVIPDSVTSIGDGVFASCSSLTEIIYQGTKERWKNIKKGSDWDIYTDNYTVRCTDGTLTKSES